MANICDARDRMTDERFDYLMNVIRFEAGLIGGLSIAIHVIAIAYAIRG